MRARPVTAGLQVPPAALPPAGEAGAVREAPPPGQASPAPALSVTSHSLTLSTKAFCLDFTWRRVETQGQPAPEADGAQGPPSSQPTRRPRAPRPAPRSFQEALRRQQLAGLLALPPKPPGNRAPLQAMADQVPGPALAGPVCRAYAQAQGPLAQPSRLFSA